MFSRSDGAAVAFEDNILQVFWRGSGGRWGCWRVVGEVLGRARRSNQGSGLRGGGPSPAGESRGNFDWCAAAGVSGLHVAMLMHPMWAEPRRRRRSEGGGAVFQQPEESVSGSHQR